MTTVPYLWINLIALCCYLVLFTAFFAAKKTPENKSFLCVLGSFILWTAGSVLMRLQAAPGVSFWFYVSLLSLFSIPVLLYLFVCNFANVRQPRLKYVWIFGTAAILVCTAAGLFLEPPGILGAGDTTFYTYELKWTIVIPTGFSLAVIISIASVFIGLLREKGKHIPGLVAIMEGCVAVVAGNLLQLMPGNVFPYDMVSGIIFAACVLYALAKKRMFRLQLLVSPYVLQTLVAGICLLAALYFAAPVEQLFRERLQIGPGATALTVAFFMLFAAGFSGGLKKLLSPVIKKQEQQNKALGEFGKKVSGTLDAESITKELAGIVKNEVGVENAYVFLRGRDNYYIRNIEDMNHYRSFAVAQTGGVVKYFETGAEQFHINDFGLTGHYSAAPHEERLLLRTLGIQCAVALKSEGKLIGILMTTCKENRNAFTEEEAAFLRMVSTIASIALKNAMLYEHLFRVARIDDLTGAYNYSYFVEKLAQDHERFKGSVALVFLDIDDMRLYNQIHGKEQGDRILKRIATIITSVVRRQGSVYRYGGKTFAILLPGMTSSNAYDLAMQIQKSLYDLNRNAKLEGRKMITLSGGICAGPDAAKTCKELTENADIALFSAKTTGKGKIKLFTTFSEGSIELTERVKKIIDVSEKKGNGLYTMYSPTIMALTAAIDAKDHYTYTHSQNVAYYASMLAVAAGFNDDQARLVYEAALLHDIGKISIPESILCKTGMLDREECKVMNQHVDNAIEIIRHLPSMDRVIPAAIAHHERWDGTGYPRGLKGEEIPVSARCLAIADVFDAMTSDRPYRKRCSLEYAVSELESNKGTQFDPLLVQVFIDLVRQGEITVASMQGHAG